MSVDDFFDELERLSTPTLNERLEETKATVNTKKRQRAECSAERWTCCICTLSNSSSNSVCEACNSPKDVVKSNCWVCNSCSAVNFQTACETCRNCCGSRNDTHASESQSDSSDSSVQTNESSSESSDSEDEENSQPTMRTLGDVEVHRFLTNLQCVPFDSLSIAPIPASMTRGPPLKPFQQQGLYWMLQREGDESSECKGGILADYMGLGKTKMLISLCESTKVLKMDRLQFARVCSTATIIVCPTSLVAQWSHEIKASVFPQPRVFKYHGAARKKSIFDLAQSFDYIITTYQTLSREPADGALPPSKLRMIYWRRVILDEAHYIRNINSLQSKAATQIVDAQFRWAVTATPLQNRLCDVFALVKFLRVPHFGDLQWWKQEIELPFAVNKDNSTSVAALQLLLSSIMLRRLPTSTLNGNPILVLPDKIVETREVKLTPEEREFYDALHANARVKIAAASRGDGTRAYLTAFEMLLRCRQCLLHPYFVVSALLQKAQREGLESKALLPTRSCDGGATKSDLDSFLVTMKKRLRAETEFAEVALKNVANQAELQDTECIVCMDKMTSPVMLPCAHMFCDECIRRALHVRHRCPLCQRTTKMTEIVAVPEVGEQITPRLTIDLEEKVLSDSAQWMTSSKAQAVIDIICRTSPDEKVVVFSHFVLFLKFLETRLNALSISSALFTGALTVKQRDNVVEHFTRRESPKVLLASITTCGVGINLTRASHCVIADISWNPGMEEQAMNRIHRIGQERPVRITRLICPTTVDEKIEALCARKRELMFYCFGRKNGAASLNRQDLLSLFS